MKALISPKQIRDAFDEACRLLDQAYTPIHEIRGERFCWEGRIANAILKSQEAIDAGTITKVQAEDLIKQFIRSRDLALGEARTAQDKYWRLCAEAGVPGTTFPKPPCDCRYCIDGTAANIQERYRALLVEGTEQGFIDETIELLKVTQTYMAQRGIKVEIRIV